MQQLTNIALSFITSVSLLVTASLFPKTTSEVFVYSQVTPLPLYSPTPVPISTPSPTPLITSTPRLLPKVTLIESGNILENINIFRGSIGLNQLVRHEGLCTYAQTRASQIQSNWSHGPFDGDITNGTLNSICPDCVRFGENLGRGYATSVATVQGWIASSGHRANMASDWSYGCGVLTSNKYSVAIFAKTK